MKWMVILRFFLRRTYKSAFGRLLKISMLMFFSFLSPDFYHIHKAFSSDNRVTVAGRITMEKVVMFALSFFHSAVVRHPLNFTALLIEKWAFSISKACKINYVAAFF